MVGIENIRLSSFFVQHFWCTLFFLTTVSQGGLETMNGEVAGLISTVIPIKKKIKKKRKKKTKKGRKKKEKKKKEKKETGYVT